MGSNLCTGLSKKKSTTSGPGSGKLTARAFRYSELEAATKNFWPDFLIGRGGFGEVYSGRIERTKQIVAVKRLDPNRRQGTREFLVEVLMLRLLHHPNVVTLKGYCADGDQRLLVYEYMPLGSLNEHLYDLPPGVEPLDWNTRMKIAAGAAKGLEYLHNTASPPVIHRDLKCRNILLDDNYDPKLSDFGMAILSPVGDRNYVSDIYSLGVVLLELITGRKASNESGDESEKSLVEWARSLFRDRTKYMQMANEKLQGQFPDKHIYHQALAIAAMCVQEEAALRPPIADVATALNYLASQNNVPENEGSGSSTP